MPSILFITIYYNYVTLTFLHLRTIEAKDYKCNITTNSLVALTWV